ncbi:lysosome-associated membrane glycoprotein 5 isoform X1 [Scleropages formosus]|uniref:lysosome-associated membrane glycoprotein 5 isoform X1 n=1 Tax=Scleropages formosus TaxID=113540 RepID=UPI0010FABFE7|nr:lysosome-associated membrane glycoprotein 5 isoform X1 [Scleropages formosus]
MKRIRFKSSDLGPLLLCLLTAAARTLAEQEVENLSGLSPNPDKDIFVVRENGTTCLMAEFAVRFTVPYDVLALNGIDLITEQASISLPRGAQIEGRCGSSEAELRVSWSNDAYTFRLFFLKEVHDSKGNEVWKISKMQFVYDTSETTHFINAYNREWDASPRPPTGAVTARVTGKHTASSHRLSALVTPAGRSYECMATQTLTLISSDHQKGVTVSMADIQMQPFDIKSDFMFSEAYKCITDQREQLEETLPLILGLILGLIIVITLSVYHLHQKMTAHQPQLPRDRSMYKNM